MNEVDKVDAEKRAKAIARATAWNRDPKNRARRRETCRRYRHTHPEKMRQFERTYAERHPEKLKAKKAKWAAANRVKRQRVNRAWFLANRVKVYAKTKRRRFERKAGRSHPTHDRLIELQIYTLAKELSKSTGVVHHVDHIIPRSKGGPHHHANLQPLPIGLNMSKKDDPFWTHPNYKSWRDVPQDLWPDSLKPTYLELLAVSAAA